MKKVWLAALSVVLTVVLLLAGCASSRTEESVADGEDYYSEGEYPAQEPANDADGGEAVEESGGAGDSVNYDSAILQPGVNRKIVYYGTINAQTENFDEDYNAIMAKLSEYGGYVQSSSVSGTKPEEWQETGRNAQMTLRVPSAKFDEFMKFLGSLGETISTSVNGEDISLQYFDTETKLETLRTREERLQELLSQASTMEDIIELEQALADVSYEIQMLEMDLRSYDSLIDYSTVTITLQEVQVIDTVTPSSPKTLGERISSGFFSVLNVLADFGEGLLIFLIAGSPVLIPVAGIIVLVVVLTKRSRRKRAKKPAAYASVPSAGPNYDPMTGLPYQNAKAAPKEGARDEASKENGKHEK